MTTATSATSAIRAVILDAGGVLLHPNLEWLAATAAELGLTVSVPELHLAYYRMMYLVDRDTTMDRRGLAVATDTIRLYLAQHMLSGAGLAPDSVARAAPEIARRAALAFPREADIYRYALPGLRERLMALTAAGYTLAVASNNDGSLTSQLTEVGVVDLLPVRFDSALEGVAKPEPELLLRAARRLDLAPAACLYVGDLDRVDGAAARAAGMHFALLDPLFQPRATRPTTIASLLDIPQHFAHG